MEGTIVFDNTHTPSDKQLQEIPHINLSPPHPWDPMPHRNDFTRNESTRNDQPRNEQIRNEGPRND